MDLFVLSSLWCLWYWTFLLQEKTDNPPLMTKNLTLILCSLKGPKISKRTESRQNDAKHCLQRCGRTLSKDWKTVPFANSSICVQYWKFDPWCYYTYCFIWHVYVFYCSTCKVSGSSIPTHLILLISSPHLHYHVCLFGWLHLQSVNIHNLVPLNGQICCCFLFLIVFIKQWFLISIQWASMHALCTRWTKCEESLSNSSYTYPVVLPSIES